MTDRSDTIIFRVDDTSDLPIWAQLRNRIAYLIRTGFFKDGDQLPSVRSLAADARINYNTVTKAYRDLELSGLIASVRGRGMFVQEEASGGDAELEAADALLENCIRQYKAQGMTYREIRNRMTALVDELDSKARTADEEMRSHGTI